MKRLIGGLALVTVAATACRPTIIVQAPPSNGGNQRSPITTTDTVNERINTVAMDPASGGVTVQGANVDKTTVRRVIHFQGSPPPGKTFHTDGPTLTISGCGDGCGIDYTITVPLGTAITGKRESGDIKLVNVGSVKLNAESGSATVEKARDVDLIMRSADVTVSDVQGGAKVGMNSGEIQFTNIGGAASASADSGSITATGLRGNVDAKAQSGEIHLTTVAPGNINATVQTGQVDITVPAGAKYRVNAHSGIGPVQAIPNTASAPNAITAKANTGDIRIHTP